LKNDINEILNKPIQYLKGIGESRAKLFQRLNLFTIEDILTHFPREYEDRSNLKKIAELQDSEECAFEGIIMSKVSESRPRKGLSIYKIYIKDESGTIIASWFNQSYIKNVFNVGESYVFYGRISRKYKSLEVQSPVYEKVDEKEMKNTCRIIPVYSSTMNLSQNLIRAAISSAIKLIAGNMEEILPERIRNRYKLAEINYSMENIHFPESESDFNNARKRLVFEELLLLQMGLLNIKNSFNKENKGICFKKIEDINDFINELPFQLTNAQKKVFMEVEENMESHSVMNRLIQGDVGSGKTMISVLALFKAVKSGFQGALMVPTEILAVQHHITFLELFEKTGIRISLLVGSQTKKQKEEILNGLKTGAIDILIGTHALIEETVIFDKLGLVITDEQHRFGVRQRGVLSQKGNNPDVLVMTATPIPRTLALILYGDLDISIIDELPPGRKPIETYTVDESKRERINTFIRKKVAEGRQVYIVCPLVEDSDTIEAKSAMELSDRIAKKDFSDLRVGLIHGKMKSKDKETVMKSFVDGEISILVSTTVIEVGVNVPNSTIMVIENAERFGLAQLHQLRGRVGRGREQSFCILYNNSKAKIAEERMKIMQKTNDGFIISEKDLELRGPGEFFGTRQHGIPDLKIANLFKDIEILKLAQEAAIELLKNDRYLSKDENLRLKHKVLEKFENKSIH
jgi:ATP-dependent DNA helicase RecG